MKLLKILLLMWVTVIVITVVFAKFYTEYKEKAIKQKTVVPGLETTVKFKPNK